MFFCLKKKTCLIRGNSDFNRKPSDHQSNKYHLSADHIRDLIPDFRSV